MKKGDTIVAIQGWKAGGGSTNTVRLSLLRCSYCTTIDSELLACVNRCVSSASQEMTNTSSLLLSNHSLKTSLFFSSFSLSLSLSLSLLFCFRWRDPRRGCGSWGSERNTGFLVPHDLLLLSWFLFLLFWLFFPSAAGLFVRLVPPSLSLRLTIAIQFRIDFRPATLSLLMLTQGVGSCTTGRPLVLPWPEARQQANGSVRLSSAILSDVSRCDRGNCLHGELTASKM